MISVEKVEGFKWRLRLRFPAKIDDISCYFSGNFNCYGHGSISLNHTGDFWVGEVTLLPGEYDYYFEVNQYYKYDDNRNPVNEPVKLLLKQENMFHDPGHYNFYGKTGQIVTVRCIGPPDISALVISVDKGNTQQHFHNYSDSALAIFEFILPSDAKSYSFLETVTGKALGPFDVVSLEEPTPSANTIYQIFPDRFARDGQYEGGLSRWDDNPTTSSFYGGNIRGIRSKTDYLSGLGVEHVYLTPFFRSRSNHRYDVDDYYGVDRMIGTLEELAGLSGKLKEQRISMIVDVVFNHTSTYFDSFQKAVNDKQSNSRSWYKFLVPEPSPFHNHYLPGGGQKVPDYETFQGYGGMPKLNHQNEQVKNFMLDVLDFYAQKLNVSFFRYDVADSIDIGAVKLILEKIRSKYPGIGHIAEIWCLSSLFTGNGMYDSAMNYPLRDLIISLLKRTITPDEFNRKYLRMKFVLGENGLKQMMNLLGSHDTERIITVLGSGKASQLAYLIMFVLDGMPTIYYGDEVGLEGGADPDCRRAFPWGSYDLDFQKRFQGISELRKSNPVTRNGLLHISSLQNSLVEIRKSSYQSDLFVRFALGEVVVPKEDYGCILMASATVGDDFIAYSKYSYTVSLKQNV